jgi:hypothetical protein
VRKFPQYALMGGKGRKGLILYEPGDPDSVAWATGNLYSDQFVGRDPALSADRKRHAWAKRIAEAADVPVGEDYRDLIGKHLIQAQRELRGTGMFQAMLKHDLPFGEDTARKLMAWVRERHPHRR